MSRLAQILDQIIPENRPKNIPAGGTDDVTDYVANALRDSNDSGAKLDAAAARFGLDVNNTPAFLRHLETSDTSLFQVLIRHAYVAYYGRPQARVPFGLSPQPTQPAGYDVPRETPEFMRELTASVMGRGPCYRPTSPKDHPNEK